jgi:hypothetical protein
MTARRITDATIMSATACLGSYVFGHEPGVLAQSIAGALYQDDDRVKEQAIQEYGAGPSSILTI